MDNLEFKKNLVEACKEKILQKVQELRNAMTDAQQSSNEYGPPKDRYDPFRNMMTRKIGMYAEQEKQEIQHFQLMDQVDLSKLKEEVGFGSLVYTNEQKLFIVCGMGKISVNGIDIFVISSQVPFYQAIAGKKKGESFEFRGKTGKIADVF